MKKRVLAGPILMLLLITAIIGCKGGLSGRSSEEVLDTRLTQPVLPGAPPVTEPPEPQEKFQQEPQGAQG